MDGVSGAARRERLVTPAFLLIAFATLGYFIAEGALLPSVPLYVKGPLGGGEAVVGLVVGAFSVSALLLRPLIGRLADLRGRRTVMLIGAALFGLSVAGYILSETVWLLIVMRLATGAGAAFFFVGAATAINDLAPEGRRGEAVSFFSLALYAGIGIGPLIGEALLGESPVRAGDFTPVWLLTAAAAAMALVLSLRVPETRPAVRDHGRLRLVHPAAILPGSVILAAIMGMAGFFAFTPLFTRARDLGDSRYVFLTFSVVVILIRGFGARLPDKLGPGRAARAALAISAAGLLTIGAWPGNAGLFGGTIVLGVGSALAFPALMTLAVSGAPPGERGAAIGTFTAFVDLAFGLGPVSLGVVADVAGLRAVYFAAAIVALTGLALLLLRGQRQRRRARAPETPVPEVPF
ncbi:MAG TPA: MFS transporter [Actinomycetota bacterium]